MENPQRLEVFQCITSRSPVAIDNDFSIHICTQFVSWLRQMRTVIVRTMEISTVSVTFAVAKKKRRRKKSVIVKRMDSPVSAIEKLPLTACPWVTKFGYCPILSKIGHCPFTNHVCSAENERIKLARQ